MAKDWLWRLGAAYRLARRFTLVIPLIVLLSGVMGLAGYTFGREYFTIAADQCLHSGSSPSFIHQNGGQWVL
eukprot:1160315-Pelagomonas_calceolata.AAC.1